MSPFKEKHHGWTLLKYPDFDHSLQELVVQVACLKREKPSGWESHPRAKLLARLQTLIFEEIPRNPGSSEYQQGNTLGKENRHWKRAKFLQRFRLFFRFDSKSKIIIYAWVNDENTLRKAGAKTDPYAVFEKRLKQGNPPSDWKQLFEESALLEEELKPV